MARRGGTVSGETGQMERGKTGSAAESTLACTPGISIMLESTCDIRGGHQGLPPGEYVSFGPIVKLEEQVEGWSQSGQGPGILHPLCYSVE